MSHKATNWAIGVRGLKPATKIVLWHLADCHNGQTGVCNPIQATLANLCEMSRSTLNEHLRILEECGLIWRHSRIDPVTGRQLSTHYSLALDAPFEPSARRPARTPAGPARTQDVVVPVSENRTRSVSGNEPFPCPENAESRVRIPDSLNPGREPGREPGIHHPPVTLTGEILGPEEDGGTRACVPSSGPTFRERILIACGADPVSGLSGPDGRLLGDRVQMMLVDQWRTELGLTEEQILAVIESLVARRRARPGSRPIGSLAYFTEEMRALAGRLKQGALLPLEVSHEGLGLGSGGPSGQSLSLGNGRNPSLASIAAWRRINGKV